MSSESKTAIYAAIAGNAALATTKFVVAGITGSSAILSEAIHSTVDTADGGLLLLGAKLSKRPPDEKHPFGHGLELYFWTFVVAVMIFAVGGGVSVYEGMLHCLHPREAEKVGWVYAIIGCGFVFEGASLWIGVRQFWKVKGRRSAWQAIHGAKDPSIFTVVLEDSVALWGLFVAGLGVYLGQRFRSPYFDGAASIVIGASLIAVASLLAWESRMLLLGEAAHPELVAGVRRLALEDQDVQQANPPLTMHFGPDNVLVALDLQFRPEISAQSLADAVARVEKAIRQRFPEVRRVFIEAQSISPCRERRAG
jgi:cation diffusion facilitator family transporter